MGGCGWDDERGFNWGKKGGDLFLKEKGGKSGLSSGFRAWSLEFFPFDPRMGWIRLEDFL